MYPSVKLVSFLGILLGFATNAIGADLRIYDASDFVDFASRVNSGLENYKDATVYLEGDLDFSGNLSQEFEPVGSASTHSFEGTFDGQGHVVSNLVTNATTLQSVGIFGYSANGTTVKNVVVDASCSITSSYDTYGTARVGAIIGACYANNAPCAIENSVNMAPVAFGGSTATFLYIGGICGYLGGASDFSGLSDITVKNCANYGRVTVTSIALFGYIGGVVGHSGDEQFAIIYIRNSVNHGALAFTRKSGVVHIGGVVGTANNTLLENCVNEGKVHSAKDSDHIGSIAGSLSSPASVSHCYWATNDGCDKLFGDRKDDDVIAIAECASFSPKTLKLSREVTVGDSTEGELIDALNAAAEYYHLRDYSRWAANPKQAEIAFVVNGRNQTAVASSVVLLPDLADEGNYVFDGWYTNEECTAPFNTSEGFDGDATLYGEWNASTKEYRIAFDTKGGLPLSPLHGLPGATVALPRDPVRENCELSHWENEYDEVAPWNYTVTAHDVTLTAVWICTRIATAADLVDMARVVNTGLSSYSGSTVYIDADLDFSAALSEQFRPIGRDHARHFQGTFDGQGYVIRNLAVAARGAQAAGLFGYSDGKATVRNVVLDATTSVVSRHRADYDSVRLGGIVGYCRTDNGVYAIENTVTLASVTFAGTTGLRVSMGAVAGYFHASRYYAVIRNSATYGEVRYSGSGASALIGGVVGEAYERDDHVGIQNALSYGRIAFVGRANDVAIGGIGGVLNAIVENCVHAGMIGSKKKSGSIGSIAGSVTASAHLAYSYWALDDGCGKAYGEKGKSVEVIVEKCIGYDAGALRLKKATHIGNYTGKSLVAALNAAASYYELKNYSRWLANREEHSVTFTVNARESPFLALTARVVLLPNLASEGKLWFDGWYTDSAYAAPLDDFEVANDTDLYGKFEVNGNQYTITFDTRGGTPVAPITAAFGTVVQLPSDSVKESYEILWWANEYDEEVSWAFSVPSYDTTLYAVWAKTRISSADDLVEFAEEVNAGHRFEGRTVFVEADIVFDDNASEHFEPIGHCDTRLKDCSHFLGTFDAQGYTISELELTTKVEQIGLFGYTEGATIRNVVLDATCTLKNTGRMYTGGILGYCKSHYSACAVESSVSMAEIDLRGELSTSRYGNYGHIFGHIAAEAYAAVVRNCASYGTIASTLESDLAFFGGIGGYARGTPRRSVYVQNCLNYGTISHKGETDVMLYVGGVVGDAYYTAIANCMHSGKLRTRLLPGMAAIGSVVGKVHPSTRIEHCLWTKEEGFLKTRGSENSTLVALNVSAVDALSAFARKNEWNEWVLNENETEVSFVMNDGSGFGLETQVVLLPGLEKEGYRYVWYLDENFTVAFDSVEILNETTLYGRFEEKEETSSSFALPIKALSFLALALLVL